MSMKTPDTDAPREDEDFSSFATASAVEEKAAMWLARMTSGEAGAEERAEFARWRAADPAHEAAVADMRKLWLGMEGVLSENVAVQAPPARRARRRRLRRWALAASLLLAAALGWQAATDWRYDEVTAAGERRSIALDDGSSILLSGGTALDLRVDAQQRRVRIVRGEAYFDVAPDASRPFIVRAGASEVRVLGTRFAVRHDGNEQRVTVERGAVEVRAGDARSVLTADQRIILRDGVPSAVEAADVQRELSWRHGRLVVDDATLADIVRALGRHHPGTILIADADARRQRFNTVIDLDRVDDWLAGLDQADSIRVVRIGPVAIIY